MPNTLPPAVKLIDLKEKKEAISGKAWIDHGLFAGACQGKARTYGTVRSRVQDVHGLLDRESAGDRGC